MENNIDYFGLVDAYLPFVVISLGLIGNTSAFLIFRMDSDFKKISAMTILSFVVVVKYNHISIIAINIFDLILDGYILIIHLESGSFLQLLFLYIL